MNDRNPQPASVVPQKVRDILTTDEFQAVATFAGADARIITFLENAATQYHGDALRECIKLAILDPMIEGQRQRQTQNEIDRGSWVIRAFDDGPVTPLYAHTVGLSVHTDTELFISGISEHAIEPILNDLGDRLIRTPTLTVKDLIPPLVYINGTKPGRVRIETLPLSSVKNEYITAMYEHLTPSDECRLMVVVLPDEHNRLPGEDKYDDTFQQLLPDQLHVSA